jgi:hypothetical protein
MQMRRPFAFLSVFFLAALLAPARAEDAPKGEAAEPNPVRVAAYATSWAAAIKDAKARVVPIVVHSHGIYCPGCHRVHAGILSDIEYMDFTYENATEVLVMDRIDEAVEKGEPAAAAREVKLGGKTISYLVNFPWLTLQDLLALNASKAGTYNKAGSLPYTCLVDPFTELEMQAWKGWQVTASQIKEGITQAREKLTKEHGKGKPRVELKTLNDVAAASAAKLEKGDFAGALDPYTALRKRAEKELWAVRLWERIEKAQEAIIAAATEALDDLEADKDLDLAKAKADLTALLPRLRGTGLEKRAKELLATL